MSIYAILYLLLTHWVADFLCQSDWMATNKSKDSGALIAHTFVYSIVFMFSLLFMLKLSLGFILQFGMITFAAHTATDYVTSRINAQLWADKKVHWFFVSIGFDQFLHFTQIFIIYQLLNNGC